MTSTRGFGRTSAILYVVAALLAAELVHLIVYAFDHGLGDGFVRAMAFGGHHSYFPLAMAATVAALIGATALAATDLRGLRSRLSIRRFAIAWAVLLAGGLVGFVAFENFETLHGDHPIAGLTPTGWLIEPHILAATAAVCAVLAIAVSILTAPRATSYAAVLTSSYATLVAEGVYDAGFRHADWARSFFHDTLATPLATLGWRRPLHVIEAGVGTGFWLAELRQSLGRTEEVEVSGFDLSPDMVGAARERLGRAGIPAELAVGDVLDPSAYSSAPGGRHDLVFVYDVVQQLPRHLQDTSVAELYRHVAPGGWLLIFDQDARSRHGRVMGAKKWLRRHLGVPLVPYHYIHSSYPSMAHIRGLLRAAGATDVEILVEAKGRHRAVMARRPLPS